MELNQRKEELFCREEITSNTSPLCIFHSSLAEILQGKNHLNDPDENKGKRPKVFSDLILLKMSPSEVQGTLKVMLPMNSTVGAEPYWKASCTSLSSKQGKSQH